MVLDRNIEREQLLRDLVLHAVENGNSKDVQDVVSEIQAHDHSFSTSEIVAAVEELEQEDRLICAHPSTSFWRFLGESHLDPSLFLRSTGVGLAFLTFGLPQAFPWTVIRVMAACILLLFSPGNALVEFIFYRRHLDTPQRIALSIGISVVLVSLTTLAVSFQLGHFSIDAVIISLALFTIGLTLASRYVVFRRNSR